MCAGAALPNYAKFTLVAGSRHKLLLNIMVIIRRCYATKSPSKQFIFPCSNFANFSASNLTILCLYAWLGLWLCKVALSAIMLNFPVPHIGICARGFGAASSKNKVGFCARCLFRSSLFVWCKRAYVGAVRQSIKPSAALVPRLLLVSLFRHIPRPPNAAPRH